jgi:hypothetical protein
MSELGVINGPMATSALSPFSPQLRTLAGAVGTAEKCQTQMLYDILAGYGQVEYRYRAHPETLRE